MRLPTPGLAIREDARVDPIEAPLDHRSDVVEDVRLTTPRPEDAVELEALRQPVVVDDLQRAVRSTWKFHHSVAGRGPAPRDDADVALELREFVR